jgi:hypothetical protein
LSKLATISPNVAISKSADRYRHSFADQVVEDLSVIRAARRLQQCDQSIDHDIVHNKQKEFLRSLRTAANHNRPYRRRRHLLNSDFLNHGFWAVSLLGFQRHPAPNGARSEPCQVSLILLHTREAPSSRYGSSNISAPLTSANKANLPPGCQCLPA